MIYSYKHWVVLVSIIFLVGCSSDRSKEGLYPYDAKRDRDFILKHFAEDSFWLFAHASYDPVDTLDTGIHGIVKKPVTFYVYYKDQKPVGFISYYYEEPLFGRIQLVDVDKQYQRQGIATKMILEILKRMQKEGVHAVELTTRLINPALSLYEKLGFRRLCDDGTFVFLEYSFD